MHALEDEEEDEEDDEDTVFTVTGSPALHSPQPWGEQGGGSHQAGVVLGMYVDG